MAETNYPLTTDRLQVWLNVRIRRMQKNLAKNKSNNSGNLRQSLGRNYDKGVKERGGFISGIIEADDYWYFVDQGVQGVGGDSDITGRSMPNRNTTSDARYRSKKPPLKAILGWVQTKLPAGGSDLFTALNIREGIYRKGLRATNFASSVLTDKDIKELTQQLAETMAEDIANNITPE